MVLGKYRVCFGGCITFNFGYFFNTIFYFFDELYLESIAWNVGRWVMFNDYVRLQGKPQNNDKII